jgi:hypothetical protein
MRTTRRAAAWFWPALLCPIVTVAQGTAADYARSERIASQQQGLILNLPEQPNWMGSTNRFWYRKTVQGGNEFVLVDAATAQQQPAFDHARVAEALSSARNARYSATTLPFENFRIADNESAIEFVLDSTTCCTLSRRTETRR